MITFDLRQFPRLPSDDGKPGPLGILLIDATGEPVMNQGVQSASVARQFLLERTGITKFVEGLEAIDAIEMQLKTRSAINEQLDIDDGLLVLEDVPGKRLAQAVLKPGAGPHGYNPAVSACLLPYMLAARDLVDGDLRAKLAKEASAKIPEQTEANPN